MSYLRTSAPSNHELDRKTQGFVKVRLAHGYQGSIVVIDAVFMLRHPTSSAWDYFLPSFYSPPFLHFNVPKEQARGSPHVLNVSVDIAEPRRQEALRIELSFGSEDRVKSYSDGAQLYSCLIKHDQCLRAYRSGKARRCDLDFEMRVFHHTASTTRPKIVASGHLRGSPWNLQGTRKLTNVCYTYFTTIRKIQNENELARIAMASEGKIFLRGTSRFLDGDPTIALDVYRETTCNRTATLPFWVPIGVIAPNHLLLHRPPGLQGAYYEVTLPEVVRVGLNTNTVLPIKEDHVIPDTQNLRTFDYLVCGDAATEIGLAAPYDEENTSSVLHLERLTEEDLFAFWRRNANSDQVSTRQPEWRTLDP